MNAKNVLICIVLIAILALLLTLAELAMPPDRNGRGRDSYGVKEEGFGALYEAMERLQADAQRGLAPPSTFIGDGTTLVFIEPVNMLVQNQPAFIEETAQWVRQGGCVVFLGPGNTYMSNYDSAAFNFLVDDEEEEKKEPRILPVELFEYFGLTSCTVQHHFDIPENHLEAISSGDFPSMSENQPYVLNPVKKGLSAFLVTDDFTSRGALVATDTDGSSYTLGLRLEADQGEVIMISDSAFFRNAAIGKADNAILATNILMERKSRLVFDEFYHGLTLRGRPAWLLTRHPYGIVAFTMFILAVLWAWRSGIRLGPPLHQLPANRRSLVEYLDAMGYLYARSGDRSYILQQIRDGLLFKLRESLQIDPSRDSVKTLYEALNKKSPERAETFQNVIGELDTLLSGQKKHSKQEVIEIARKAVQCL